MFSKRPDISYQKKNKINKQINKFSKNIPQTTNLNNTICNRAIYWTKAGKRIQFNFLNLEGENWNNENSMIFWLLL